MVLVTNSAQLLDFCSAVGSEEFIAVDTEFVREKTYWPTLCLIQVAARHTAAVIDVLADGIDLRPLFDLMVNERVLKVFHSASQDLGIFHHDMGALPAPVFDTQLAAMVCGFGEQPAYASLVQQLTGAVVDKGSQLTDWAIRPLTERQIDYALADVTHLIKVYEELGSRLSDNGREAWFREEMRSLSAESTYVIEPREQWRRVRIRRPTRRALAILRELAEWREITAQRRNLPRNWVLRDEALTEIAFNAPASITDLSRVRAIASRTAEGGDGRAILKAVQSALALPENEWPQPDMGGLRTDVDDNLVALLQALLRLRCDEHGVAMPLVANRRDLEALACGATTDVRALTGWRRKVFGEDAVALREGRLALSYGTGGVKALRT